MLHLVFQAQILNEKELKGVISHEISHIKNKDTLISTIAVILAGAVTYIAIMARWAFIFGGSNEERGNFYEILALSIIAPVAATILRLSISRTREFMADELGVVKQGTSDFSKWFISD